MRSILYYIISKIKKLQNKNTEIDTEISGIKQDISNIIDSGTTDGINYTKYSDGTLIQYGVVTIKATDSRSAGGLTYYSGRADITLPYNFKDTTFSCFSSVALANMNLFCNSYVSVNSSSEISVSFVCTTQNDERRVSFACIGKWK